MPSCFTSLRATAFLAVFLLAGCGGGGDDAGAPSAGANVGAAGGTVAGPNGASLVFPPGALTTETPIRIEQTNVGAPALPAGYGSAGPMFALTPHGTTLSVPVTLTLPFDRSAVPAGATPLLMKTNERNEWRPVAGATFGADLATAGVNSFSFVQVVVPLTRDAPRRLYSFEGPDIRETGRSDEGVLDLRRLVGPASAFDRRLDGDDTSALEVFSSADGVTFWVGSESGKGQIILNQSQSFVKNSDDATLEFVVTAAVVAAIDFNLTPTTDECPFGSTISTCSPISALAHFEMAAFDDRGDFLEDANGRPILSVGTALSLRGNSTNWSKSANRAWDSVSKLFPGSELEMTDNGSGDGRGNSPRIRLIRPHTIRVDLSAVPTGTTFWIDSELVAYTRNERQRESGVVAFVRDPSRTGGTIVSYSGLTPTGLPPPPRREPPPIRCVGGPDPAAGVLAFAAARFDTLEPVGQAESSRVVVVTRTGGSKGLVSAQFATGGGTAVDGTHYAPRVGRVLFADGDTEPAVIDVETLPNATAENDTTVGLTLSNPGGCAVLGPQSTAVLAIADNDRPPPAPPSGLDPSFGNAGKVTTTAFGGDESAMALQGDGKIVMVGGSVGAFVMARYNADGSLDAGFGNAGLVSTDVIVSAFVAEVARAAAIQADGKIVVAGDFRSGAGPFTFVLARYNANGSLDTGFGTAGLVIGPVSGRAFAVAVQPDGRIVVAGDDPVSEDFRIARYNSNGSLDAGFGTGGQVTTDIAAGPDTVRNIVLQPDGAIVVSGDPFGNNPGTALARYTATGSLDASFGVAGKVTLAGARVGRGLALQRDGRLLLAGSAVVGSVSQFATTRLNADGSVDTRFGASGTVVTDMSGLGDAANAVAVQGDGRIVVAGRSSNINGNFAVARYLANGALDTSFANAGKLTVDFFGFSDAAESVAIQADGKIVLGGLARNNVDGYGLARVLP